MNTSFYTLLTEAVQELVERGFTPELLSQWQSILRGAARSALGNEDTQRKAVQKHMNAIFKRLVAGGQLSRYHPGVARFTLERLAPSARNELDRRILASVDLIKLNREQAIEKTLQRFSGWATSIPVGGSKVVDKVEVKLGITKTLKQVRYEERRVTIDQGHKLISNINAVVAQESGAIAAVWRSHFRRPGYQFRPDHKERDGKVYVIRGNWAMDKGLMNKGDGYVEDIEAPAQLPYCQCFYRYIHNLRDLPAEVLTAKGKKILEETRVR